MPNKTNKRTLPVRWNRLTLVAIAATGTPPPMASRILAIVHSAMYDAWAMYKATPAAYRLGSYLRRPEVEHIRDNREEAISYAAYWVLKRYFSPQVMETKGKTVAADIFEDLKNLPGLTQTPDGKITVAPTLFEDMMHHLGYDPIVDAPAANSPAAIGMLAARAILEYRDGDGANTWNTLAKAGPAAYADYTGYQPALGSGDIPEGPLATRWQPLKKPDNTDQVFLAPHWGLVQPFALRHGAEFRPIASPEPHYSARFQSQCKDVIDLSDNLGDETKAIAEYWADGPGSVTPPGHWCLLAQHISRRDRHGLGDDVRMFFALANALMDAGIACWECKRHYDYVRPVTAIRHSYEEAKICAWGGPGKESKLMAREAWNPYIPTPPFAEYPSGHSTYSAASADILKRFTGSDYFDYGVDIAKNSSKIEPGKSPTRVVPLHWATFSQAAAQAGLSRRYGGIHFEDGDLRGRDLGEKVAGKVWDKCCWLWQGGA